MLYLILIGLVLLVCYVFYRRIRKFTRGTNLGWRTGSLGDPSYEVRQKRFIRIASAHERDQARKYKRKAERTRNPAKKNRFTTLAEIWSEREEMAIKVAKNNKGKHGIRRRGTERGIHPDDWKGRR